MLTHRVHLLILPIAMAFLVAACGTSVPASTPVPAKPAATAAPAAPAATTAPAAPAQPTAAPAAKVDFPTKPLSMIIPFPAGGSTDVGGRIVAALLEKELGQPVQVINKGGAGGQLGWTDLAAAKPDGYTIGMLNLPHLPAVVVDPERKASFKQEDIVPLASQALDPTQIAVGASSPYKTVKDLVDDAQKRGKDIKVGIVGIMQDDEIGYLQTAEAAKFQMQPVRFDGAAPAITALLGGHIDVTFCTVGDNYVQSKDGKIKVLAVLDKERTTKFFPNVPTMKELGYGDLYSASTRGFGVPKGVPEPVMKKLEDALLKAMKSDEHVKKIEDAGQPVKIMAREEFTKYYNDSYSVAKSWVGKAIKGID